MFLGVLIALVFWLDLSSLHDNGSLLRVIDIGVSGGVPINIDPSGGKMFLSTSENNVARLAMVNVATGDVQQSVPLHVPPLAIAAGDRGRRIFLAYPSRLDVLNERALRHTVRLPGDVQHITALRLAGPSAYVLDAGATTCGALACTAQDGSVQVLDIGTARYKRSITLHGQGWDVIDADRSLQRLVVGRPTATGGGIVEVIDTHTGRKLQSFGTPFPPARLLLDRASGHLFIETSGGVGGDIETVDARTGRRLRSSPLLDTPRGVAIDRQTGRLFVLEDGPIRSVRTVTGGTSEDPRTYANVYLPTGQGALLTFATDTGAPVRSIRVGVEPTALAVSERWGRVLVTNRGGERPSISVIDARDGRGLGTFVLPSPPLDMSVEDQSGHVFVVAEVVKGQVTGAQADSATSIIATLRALLTRLGLATPLTNHSPPGSSTLSTLDLARLATVRTLGARAPTK